VGAADLLRTARYTQGASQRELARVAAVGQPRIADIESGAHDTTVDRLDHLLAALGQRIAVLPTRSRPVCEAAVAIKDALDRGDYASAWREIIQVGDDLARAEPATRVALTVTRPLPVGDPRFDALLAAVADHRLTSGRLPRPGWLDLPDYRLEEPWDVEVIPDLQVQARARTPRAIARHGIFLAAAQLESI
jgi:transcriptional regulator with XRE-family HTH domain